MEYLIFNDEEIAGLEEEIVTLITNEKNSTHENDYPNIANLLKQISRIYFFKNKYEA